MCPNIDTLQNRLQGSQSLLSRAALLYVHRRGLGRDWSFYKVLSCQFSVAYINQLRKHKIPVARSLKAKQKNILMNGMRMVCESVMITKPDKVNGIVIINLIDYLNKMKQLISEVQETYA